MLLQSISHGVYLGARRRWQIAPVDYGRDSRAKPSKLWKTNGERKCENHYKQESTEKGGEFKEQRSLMRRSWSSS